MSFLRTKPVVLALVAALCVVSAKAHSQNGPTRPPRPAAPGFSLEDFRGHLVYAQKLVSGTPVQRRILDDQRAFEAIGYVSGLVSALRLVKQVQRRDVSCSNDPATIMYKKIIDRIEIASPGLRTWRRDDSMVAIVGAIYPCISVVSPQP